MKVGFLNLFFLLGVAIPSQISAQEKPAIDTDERVRVPDNGAIIYPAVFFEPFRPQTALDILARTPGFSLDSGGEARGFGANAGNVLIDGQRPVVKTGGIEAALIRIAASRVERIELVRSAWTADAMGRAVMANIILRADTGGSGSGSLELRRAPGGGEVTPRTELNYAWRSGDWQFSGGILAWYENNPDRGHYKLYDVDAALLSSPLEEMDQRQRGGTLSGAASGPLGGGTLSLNTRLAHEHEAYKQTLRPEFGLPISSTINGLSNQWDGELGADWTRQLGQGWTAKLVTLGRGEKRRFSERAMTDSNADAFTQHNRTMELVGRATVQRQGDHALLPEFGGEIAWNRLDSNFQVRSSASRQQTKVSELRADIFANASLRVTPRLRLEAGMGFEMSRIGVDSDERLTRTLRFWKPNAALAWDIANNTQVRIGLRRTVGQLDFEAFATSGNLIDNRPIVGNAELQPETTTAFSGSVDYRFGSGGAVSLELAREKIDNALVYVPLDLGGQALANFGSVSLWRMNGKATLPLDGLVNGARLTVEGEVVSSSRADPLTGLRRPDFRDEDSLKIAWRHDLGKRCSQSTLAE